MELNSLFLALIPTLAVVAGVAVWRHLVRHWHDDAERVQRAIAQARWSLGLTLLATPILLVLFSLGEGRDWLGFRSAVYGRFGVPHIAAVLGAVTALLFKLHGHRDRVVILTLISALLTAGLLTWLDLPFRAQNLWCYTFISWLLPVAPCCLRMRSRIIKRKPHDWISTIHERGAVITPLREVRSTFERQLSISFEAPINFGFRQVPIEIASGHFLIAGAPGSGKTILFRLMMQSVLPRLRHGSNQRAVIFDVKHEQVSVLKGMGLAARVRILNPFDARCAVLDFARDFKTPADALQFAKLLLPDQEGDRDPFWRNSARGIIADVVRAHILAHREERLPRWNLGDIIRSLNSFETIKEALALHKSTRDALRNLREEKVLFGVLSTVDLVRREFEVVAALMDEPSRDPDRRFSLTEWMESSEILVLGPSVLAEETINPLNRLIIERIGQLVLDRPEHDPSTGTNPSRTWMFLDEFPRLGRMHRMESMMTNGRSKGLVAVLGIQDISDIRQIYGQHFAATITGACTHKAMLQAPSPESAEWAAQLIGSEEVVQIARSESGDRRNSSDIIGISHGASVQTRSLFTKDDFLYLGKPGERTPLRRIPNWLRVRKDRPFFRVLYRYLEVSMFNPVRAVCAVQGRVYLGEMPFSDAVNALAPRKGKDLIPRGVEEQFLLQWDEEPAVAPPVTPVPPTLSPEQLAALQAITRPNDSSPTRKP
jgi:hypothetical protein